MAGNASPADETMGGLVGAFRALLGLLRQRFCRHEFAIEDLKSVNPDGDERVQWPCSRCGKIFRAHCGLDITPAHGFMFRRGPPSSRHDR